MTSYYRQAIKWIAENDDTEWLDQEEVIISVTAALVSDVFNKSSEIVIADLSRVRKLISSPTTN